ncbi:hypothetical protein H9P43_008170 [Blastocladiella emersonii ATCC 22665]|nr:hypothetical protein H9P43_008170 [Blastocladiella emersonii ATCC 22665]
MLQWFNANNPPFQLCVDNASVQERMLSNLSDLTENKLRHQFIMKLGSNSDLLAEIFSVAKNVAVATEELLQAANDRADRESTIVAIATSVGEDDMSDMTDLDAVRLGLDNILWREQPGA